ncbi:MAG: hypothetical protein H6514_15675 [Acidimicrobiaceae bacterium]|nr:hypothetical protein [Acidimicrobiaceae bacterium]
MKSSVRRDVGLSSDAGARGVDEGEPRRSVEPASCHVELRDVVGREGAPRST